MFKPWLAVAPIRTERLELRGPSFDDVTRLARLADDPSVARMLTFMPSPFEAAHASALISDLLASNTTGEGLGMVVARRNAPNLMLGLVSFAMDGEKAEIGWWFGRAYWGHGYATEAVAAMVGAAFANPALERLTAGAFADNAASLRVHEKLGFRETRRSERRSVARGGEAPHVDMTLTRADWMAGAIRRAGGDVKP